MEPPFQVVRDSLIKVGHGVQYLEDSGTTVMGVSIWGSPWQPEFYDWAFNETRGRHLRQIWDRIPSRSAAAAAGGGGASGGIDVLITHGPPLGHGDRCNDGKMAGCADLLLAIQQRIRPKYHVFGHIHEGYGATSDGVTTFVNASTCTAMYKPLNAPIVFDVMVPDGAASE